MTIACKICSPPGPGMCPRCEAEVTVLVLEATDRIGARLAGISRQLAGAELLKEGRLDLGSNERRPVV